MSLPMSFPVEYFWSRVNRTSDCWIWMGTLVPDGYGDFQHRRTHFRAHRAAWMLTHGDVPPGLVLDHLCRNRACVNPGHLEPVTVRENTLRGETAPAANVRKTHCPQGHRYEGDNLAVRPHRKTGTFRQCRECHREACRKSAARLVDCECGATMSAQNLRWHRRSSGHAAAALVAAHPDQGQQR